MHLYESHLIKSTCLPMLLLNVMPNFILYLFNYTLFKNK